MSSERMREAEMGEWMSDKNRKRKAQKERWRQKAERVTAQREKKRGGGGG